MSIYYSYSIYIYYSHTVPDNKNVTFHCPWVFVEEANSRFAGDLYAEEQLGPSLQVFCRFTYSCLAEAAAGHIARFGPEANNKLACPTRLATLLSEAKRTATFMKNCGGA